MNNKQSSRDILSKAFNGTIDDLLAFTDQHAEFVDDIHSGKEPLTPEEALKSIQDAIKCSPEEAQVILKEIQNEVLDTVLQELIKEGLVEKSYGENGEELYKLTEAGAVELERIKKENKQ